MSTKYESCRNILDFRAVCPRWLLPPLKLTVRWNPQKLVNHLGKWNIGDVLIMCSHGLLGVCWFLIYFWILFCPLANCKILVFREFSWKKIIFSFHSARPIFLCWLRVQTVIRVTHKEISLKVSSYLILGKGVLATSVRVFNLIPTLNISARDKTKLNYLVANCPESLSWQEGIFLILKMLKITFHVPINEFFSR